VDDIDKGYIDDFNLERLSVSTCNSATCSPTFTYPDYVKAGTNPLQTDADRNGIPEFWTNQSGNANSAGSGAVQLSDNGYCWIERYINSRITMPN